VQTQEGVHAAPPPCMATASTSPSEKAASSSFASAPRENAATLRSNASVSANSASATTTSAAQQRQTQSAAITSPPPPGSVRDVDFATEVRRINLETPDHWREILGLRSGEDAQAPTKYRGLMKVLHPDKRTESGVALAGGTEVCNEAQERVQGAMEMAKGKQIMRPSAANQWCAAQPERGRADQPPPAATFCRSRPRPPDTPPVTEEDLPHLGFNCPMPPPHTVTGRMFLGMPRVDQQR
jgi:hypothetical protein